MSLMFLLELSNTSCTSSSVDSISVILLLLELLSYCYCILLHQFIQISLYNLLVYHVFSWAVLLFISLSLFIWALQVHTLAHGNGPGWARFFFFFTRAGDTRVSFVLVFACFLVK